MKGEESIKLLGKDLYELDLKYSKLDVDWLGNYFSSHNLEVMRNRLKAGDLDLVTDSIVVGGDGIRTTRQILKTVRFMYEVGIFTKEEWQQLIPCIEEKGLLFNKEYCEIIDKMAALLEPFFDKYEGAKETLEKRLPLEFWQGRLSEHWANPQKDFQYK